MRRDFDLSLYFIVGPSHVAGDPVALVQAAIRGGVSLIQLRDKTSGTRQMVESARRLLAALNGTGVKLFINDRVDVALASGAYGVHLGASDMTPEDARRIAGDGLAIGLTVKTVEEVRRIDPAIVDYASIGGVFDTKSKQNDSPPLGLDGLREMVSALDALAPDMPRCAIAGIDLDKAGSVAGCGLDGVCTISAIAMAPDAEQAAQAIRRTVDANKRGRERAFA